MRSSSCAEERRERWHARLATADNFGDGRLRLELSCERLHRIAHSIVRKYSTVSTWHKYDFSQAIRRQRPLSLSCKACSKASTRHSDTFIQASRRQEFGRPKWPSVNVLYGFGFGLYGDRNAKISAMRSYVVLTCRLPGTGYHGGSLPSAGRPRCHLAIA